MKSLFQRNVVKRTEGDDISILIILITKSLAIVIEAFLSYVHACELVI